MVESNEGGIGEECDFEKDCSYSDQIFVVYKTILGEDEGKNMWLFYCSWA